MKYKILTVCFGGCVRSVGCKFVLHMKYKHDVLACGVDHNTPETIEMLCNWADYIIIMQPEFKEHIKEQFHDKLFCYDIGEDRFGYAFHPELQTMVDSMIQQHGLFNK